LAEEKETRFMPGPGQILRELHRLHKHAKDLRTEIDRGPHLLKAHQAKVAKQEDALREAQESIKKRKVAMHEKEVSLKDKELQIGKHEKQLNEATSKKEYDALRAEVEADRKAVTKIEDEILDIMGEIESKTIQAPELERAVQRAKEEAARAVTEIQSRRDEFTDRLNEVHKSLHEVEAALPEDIRAQYERLLASRGEDAMSVVHNRTCTACYTEITAQNMQDLSQGLFILCKNCGRILYLPE
jgi:predicted  nucleic acid-binding Zn-ribbon protein